MPKFSKVKHFFSLAHDSSTGRHEPSGAQRHDNKIADRDNARREVIHALGRAMKHPDKPAICYICRNDIDKIWSDHLITTVLFPRQLSESQRRYIRKNCILILSVLIYIGAYAVLDNFESFFLGADNAERSDQSIPLRGEALHFIEDLSRRRDFETHQYAFKPQEIEENYSRETQELDSQVRLPFEAISAETFAGGYGEVQEVWISRDYLVDKDRNSSNHFEPTRVAVKKVRLNDDFKKERRNLQLLRDSISKPDDGIMLYIATIIHGDAYYILLPFAKHYNLDFFLHEGRDIWDDRLVYDFKTAFPEHNPGTGDIKHLLDQCFSLTLALKWLHHELRISSNSAAKVHCAHMDLKPDNILIDHKRGKPVGVWKLCDFGISVIHDNDEARSADYASVGDMFLRAGGKLTTMNVATTMNTKARRGTGAYQAPEVAGSGKPGEVKVGRKSDVWSLVSIFAEIFTFALEGAKGVENFQDARANQYRDDAFYEETAPGGPFVVRATVSMWFAALRERHPRRLELETEVDVGLRWLEQGLDLIEKFLEPDAERRMNSIQLVTRMEAIIAPYRRMAAREQALTLAPLSTIDSPIVPRSGSVGLVPSIIIGDDSGSRPMVDEHVDTEERGLRSHGSETASDVDSVPSGSSNPFGITLKGSPLSSPSTISKAFLTTDSKTSYSSPTTRGFTVPFESGSKRRWWPGNSKPMAVALAASEVMLAYLMVGPECFIHTYMVSLDGCAVSVHGTARLSQDDGWRKLVVAGRYLAAWGSSKETKGQLLHATSLDSDLNSAIGLHPRMADFQHVAISAQGILALICDKKLYLYSIPFQRALEWSFSFPNSPSTTAEFSDDGTILYAWVLGTPNDRFYVWRIEGETVTLVQEKLYLTEREGGLDVRYSLIPFNTGQIPGCVIYTNDKRYFVGRPTPSSSGINDKPTYPYKANLSKIISASMLDDEFLFALEDGSKGRYVSRYPTYHAGKPAILEGGREVVWMMEKGTPKVSVFKVFRDGEDVVFLLLGLAGFGQFVRFS